MGPALVPQKGTVVLSTFVWVMERDGDGMVGENKIDCRRIEGFELYVYVYMKVTHKSKQQRK